MAHPVDPGLGLGDLVRRIGQRVLRRASEARSAAVARYRLRQRQSVGRQPRPLSVTYAGADLDASTDVYTLDLARAIADYHARTDGDAVVPRAVLDTITRDVAYRNAHGLPIPTGYIIHPDAYRDSAADRH